MKYRMTSLVAAFLLGTSGFALADAAEEVKAGLAAFAAAFNAGDAATMATYYTEDAYIMPPDAPLLQGREAIQGVWQSFIDAGITDMSLTSTVVEDHDNTVHEIGAFTLSVPDGNGGVTQAVGKYIVIYERGADGNLYLDWDIWNFGS